MTSRYKGFAANLIALLKGEKPYSESLWITLFKTAQNAQNDVETNKTTTDKRPSYCF